MKYITVLLFCALGFASSCSNMLDQYSHSAIPPEAVTEKDLPALRLGMYNRVQNEPQARSFIMCDILGGDITQSNYNPIDVINSTLSPLNSAIVNGWNGYYSALYQVNNLLAVTAKFPDSEISVRARGEAHYFRAYIYFCLVSRWDGVPLLRENTLDKLPRSPAADVWALIEEDLDTAASLLDTSESYYYVSRNAALALKARVMLSQGKMTEAARLAEDLITSGPYKLDSFDKIFRKKANTEIIFAFENISEESSINISDLFYTYGHPNKGQGVYRLPASTVELFGANDTRKEMSVINIAGTDCLNKYPSGQTGKDPVIVSRRSAGPRQGRRTPERTAPRTRTRRHLSGFRRRLCRRRPRRTPPRTAGRELHLSRYGAYGQGRRASRNSEIPAAAAHPRQGTAAESAAGTQSRLLNPKMTEP